MRDPFDQVCPNCELSEDETGMLCDCGVCQSCCTCGSYCECAACLERFEAYAPLVAFEHKLGLAFTMSSITAQLIKRVSLALIVAFLGAQVVQAKDFGSIGQVYPIVEEDFLEMIKDGFQGMEDDGRMARIREEAVETVKARVERPRGAISPRATTARSFTVDLSVTLERDLADQNGRVFARAGTVVNPMQYSRFNKRIVMIDGDDPEQVAFALSEGNELDTLIVLARGAPLELMRGHGRRFWFDADQQMLTKFGIQALPSVVTRADPLMRVEEVPMQEVK